MLRYYEKQSQRVKDLEDENSRLKSEIGDLRAENENLVLGVEKADKIDSRQSMGDLDAEMEEIEKRLFDTDEDLKQQ